jgi:hypothetical protein
MQDVASVHHMQLEPPVDVLASLLCMRSCRISSGRILQPWKLLLLLLNPRVTMTPAYVAQMVHLQVLAVHQCVLAAC